jgi:hypothetical protein
MLGLLLGYGFLGALALVLMLTFAASGITWLVATVMPGAAAEGRRTVGVVAGATGIALAAVLVIGAVLIPPNAGPVFLGGPVIAPGQQGPGVPQPQQQPRP